MPKDEIAKSEDPPKGCQDLVVEDLSQATSQSLLQETKDPEESSE
jgi:hypothetical protein